MSLHLSKPSFQRNPGVVRIQSGIGKQPIPCVVNGLHNEHYRARGVGTAQGADLAQLRERSHNHPLVAHSTGPNAELETLLAEMKPEARPGRFVFVELDSPGIEAELIGSGDCEAWINETEGPCAILRESAARRLELPYDSVWAWLTLGVYSDLEAVGLTAAVSESLACAGLSCNVIAGLRHDHLLVPFEAADDALATLEALSAASRDK